MIFAPKKLFLLLFFFLPMTSALAHEKERPELTVTGTATVKKAADQVSLVLGVVTYDSDVKKASASNADKMQKLYSALKSIGLTEQEMKTATFSIQPQNKPAPKNPPEDWQPSIAGYQVKNSIEVETTNLALIEDIIGIASQENANLIQELNFSLQNETSASAEAIAKAIEQAKSYANAAAKAADTKLKKIIGVQVNSTYSAPRQRSFPLASMAFAKDVKTPIHPSDIDITASVNLIYALDD